ncbi:T9SS type A sorting domain-containing protein [Flavobacterium sp. GCM10027622]|uniref:T9SS type A sorting domain-containing protein n=1 Tax=unclassified Flavobacterium TaxID=196869 RepID=UPI00361E104C
MFYHYTRGAFLLFLMTFCVVSSSAQDQQVEYQSSLGGIRQEYLFDAIPTSDDGFLIAGSTTSNRTGNMTQANKGDLDYWVCKMDAHNNLLWQKTYGGSGMDLLQSVKATSDGGYILAGISTSGKNGDKLYACQGSTDYWIVKIDNAGGIQWQNTIGGNGQEKLSSIVQTADGGYAIAGSSSSAKSKPDANGVIASHLKKEDSKGGLDFWMVKLEANGRVSWQKTLGGRFQDELKVIQPLANNEYLIGGYSNSPQSGDKTSNTIGLGDYWILKVDATGSIIWQQTLGGTGDDVLVSLMQTQDGGFIVGGNSGPESQSSNNRKTQNSNKTKSNAKGTDLWVIKLDSEGVSDWQETFNFGTNDVFSTLTEDTDGTLLIGGFAQSELKNKGTGLRISKEKEGINDYIALKIDGKGKELWSQTIGSRGDEVLKKVIPTKDGGYLLAGTSNGEKSRDKNNKIGGNDYWIVKLKNTEKKKIEKILAAYPNPAVSSTNVSINFEYERGTATLYDINGRQLQVKQLNGEQEIPFALNNLPQGVYLINVSTNNGTQAVKILKK